MLLTALLRMRHHRRGIDPLDGGPAAAAVLAVGRAAVAAAAAMCGAIGAALLRPLWRPLLLLLVHVLLLLLDLLGSFVHGR